MILPDEFMDSEGQIKKNMPDYDGGDSCNFAGLWFYGIYLKYTFGLLSKVEFKLELDRYRTRIKKLYAKYGIFKRHSLNLPWTTEMSRMSRDQLITNIIALGEAKETWLLIKILFFLILRLGFLTNIRRNGTTKDNHGQKYLSTAPELTNFQQFVVQYNIPFFPLPKGYRNYNAKLPDFAGPDVFAAIFRSLRWNFMYPFVFISDIMLVLQAKICVYNSNNHPEETNESNFFIMLGQARLRIPTPASKLAAEIYKTRKLAPLGILRTYKSDFGPQTALDHFYEGRNGIEPPIHNLFRPISKKLLDL